MTEERDIATRLSAVQQRIAQACARCGRDQNDVTLVAVSKFHPPSAIRAAYAAGQRQFGESYAQELSSKALALSDLPDIHFRFIGGLQTNKVRLLVEAHASIDTVASVSAARAIASKASASGTRKADVLLQVNVAAEPQKSGVSLSDLPGLIEAVRGLPELSLRGLMTIPPADDEALTRRCFRTLRELAGTHQLSTLSMGMSDDLEIAIEEGSTMLRVGTAIFGPRPAA